MSKKETYICLFKSCCQAQEEEKELIIPDKAVRQRKETKVSLKKNLQRTNSSNFSRFENKSLQKRYQEKNQHFYQSMKQNNLSSTNQSVNSPCQIYIPQNLPLKGRQSKQTSKQPLGKDTNFEKFTLENSGIFFQSQLQRTAKLKSSTLKPIHNMGGRFQADLEQTKQINKKTILSNLSSFKQSVVSISNNNDSVHQKFEQSMIMIDYFNPHSSKVLEIHNYLQKRE